MPFPSSLLSDSWGLFQGKSRVFYILSPKSSSVGAQHVVVAQ